MKRGGSFAPAEQVYHILLQQGSNFLFPAGMSLARLSYPSTEAAHLKSFLPALKIVKSTRQFPWMAVSKVLHFANPGLFPMWDWDVIWGRVMGKNPGGGPAAFHAEYQMFCHKRHFSVWENRPEFVLYYTLWAASCIQFSNPEFMGWFSEWMDQRFAADITQYGLGQSLSVYYATAFEFIAIGAAYLEIGE